MSRSRIRKPTLIVLALLLAFVATSFAPQASVPTNTGNTIALKAPSFVSVANAEEAGPAAPIVFPQDEVGISAYFKSNTPIVIANVKSVYRTVELQTADYIIGSVAVAGYPETYDVHLYVHKDGWFVAYYLATDPTAKMADLIGYNGTSVGTVLEKTLVLVAGIAGIPYPGSTFYDFRYPSATHLTLILEVLDVDNTFTVQLPSTLGYWERSWGLLDQGGEWYFRLDGTNVATIGPGRLGAGFLTAAQLLQDTVHTVQIDNVGVLAITYTRSQS